MRLLHNPPARIGRRPQDPRPGAPLLLFLALLLAPVVVVPAPAGAQHCEISVGNLEFGSYSFFSPAAEEAAGRITVRCDAAAVPVEISLDAGAHGGGFAPRRMRQGARDDILGYLIFTDSGMTTIWGDGTRGSVLVRKTVGQSAVEIPVYGRIPPGQDVSAGRFSDRVTVRVDW
ncbi:MAG TPA: spore coat U domain-containing protein [Candidatus Methanoperedens sp.]|nr:spore coat U domain-containing protein [Candidatus Methanoperedens sp.]